MFYYVLPVRLVCCKQLLNAWLLKYSNGVWFVTYRLIAMHILDSISDVQAWLLNAWLLKYSNGVWSVAVMLIHVCNYNSILRVWSHDLLSCCHWQLPACFCDVQVWLLNAWLYPLEWVEWILFSHWIIFSWVSFNRKRQVVDAVIHTKMSLPAPRTTASTGIAAVTCAAKF